jgi:nucleoside-diphosphate-sugar epimerase
MPYLSIVDIRIFNYFSHKQNMDAGFLIADIARAISENKILETSKDLITRDYIGAEDLYQLVRKIIAFGATNEVVDCYSKAPIDKLTLLRCMQEKFGLRYQLRPGYFGLNATGAKVNYYSLNKKATEFGYEPKFTSLDLVSKEMSSYLNTKL